MLYRMDRHIPFCIHRLKPIAPREQSGAFLSAFSLAQTCKNSPLIAFVHCTYEYVQMSLSCPLVLVLCTLPTPHKHAAGVLATHHM